MRPLERSLVVTASLAALVLSTLAFLNGTEYGAAHAAQPEEPSNAAPDSAPPEPETGSPSTDAEAGADESGGSIGVCDVYEVVEKLLASDRYLPDLEEKQRLAQEQLKPMQEQLQRLLDEVRAATDPESPDVQQKIQTGRQLEQEYNRLEQRLTAEFQAFYASKWVEAYEEAIDAVDAVGEELGYDLVVASRPARRKIETVNPNQVLQSMLGRPVLRVPEGDDITPDVLDDLNLS